MSTAEICAIHGKKRLIQDLYIDGGKYRCLANKICRFDRVGGGVPMTGANPSVLAGSQTHHTHNDAEVCTSHGKKRLIADMVHDAPSNQWMCLPNKICRDDNAKCRKHGRLRLLSDLDAMEGSVDYECKPNRVCYAQGVHHSAVVAGTVQPTFAGAFEEQLAAASSAANTASANQQTSLSAAMYAPQASGHRNLTVGGMSVGGVAGMAAGSPQYRNFATEVWCHLHGKRIPIGRAERVEDSFNVCRDKFACLAAALDPVEVLVDHNCTEVFCSGHGIVRSPQFLVLGERGYRCNDAHLCHGTTSQAILEKFRRWEY